MSIHRLDTEKYGPNYSSSMSNSPLGVRAWLLVQPIGLATVAALTVAMFAVSSSAPLTAYAAAPALAIAMYRTAIAVGVIAPFAGVTRRGELLDLVRTPAGRRTARLCALAGIALAAHFATWLSATKMTTVANATALVATQPVWAACICVWRRIPVARTMWIGIGIAVIGMVLATGTDIAVSGRAAVGDLLAVVGAALAAIYTTYGEQARTAVSTTTYTLVCYSVCAAVLLVVDLAAGVRLHGYDARTWAAILGIVVGAQLLGHSMINFALHRVSATAVSVLLLLEVPGAAVLGWLIVDQVPPMRSLPGLVVGVIGVAVVIIGAAGWRRGPGDAVATPAAQPTGATLGDA
jgi:drug/metabolite transporter (DMT)-like permease